MIQLNELLSDERELSYLYHIGLGWAKRHVYPIYTLSHRKLHEPVQYSVHTKLVNYSDRKSTYTKVVDNLIIYPTQFGLAQLEFVCKSYDCFTNCMSYCCTLSVFHRNDTDTSFI